jgi:plasmid stabilization system protein ParE
VRIIWSTGALTDLQLAVADAMHQDLDWADAILAQTQRVEAVLMRHPRLGPVVGGSDYRKLRLGPLPFVLVYQISGDAIDILRLHHAASDWRA